MGTSVTLEIETRCGTVIFHGNEAGNEIVGAYHLRAAYASPGRVL